MKYKVGDKVKIINSKEGYTHRKHYIGRTVTVNCTNPNGERTYDEPHYSVKEVIPFVFFESELVPVNTRKIVITSDGTETLARLYEGNKVIKTATAKCSPEDTFDFETGARIAFDRLIESPLAKALKSLRDAAASVAKNIKPLKFEVGKQYADGELVIEITEANRETRRYQYKVIKGTDNGPLKFFGENSAFGTRLTPCDPPKYFTGKAVCIKSDKDFTVGKVYEFTNGQTTDNNGNKRPRGYRIEKSFDVWKKKSYDMYDFLPIVE